MMVLNLIIFILLIIMLLRFSENMTNSKFEQKPIYTAGSNMRKLGQEMSSANQAPVGNHLQNKYFKYKLD